MLVSSLFVTVAGLQQSTHFGEANATFPPTPAYSLNEAPETWTVTENSRLSNSENGTAAERTTMLDIVDDLPANMKLSLSESPVLNSESKLTLIIEPRVDALNTEVRIVLPEGFSLSAGSLRWVGDLQKDYVFQINASVRARMIGNWCIEAIATSKPAIGYPKICSTQCYVQVTPTEAHFFAVAPEDFAKTEAIKLECGKGLKYVGESTGNVTVCGTWYYQDQIGRLKPVRYAMVQLWADAAPSDVYLATTYVQSDGYYEFCELLNNNGSIADGYNIYVKLFCDSYQYPIVRVGLSRSNDPNKPPSVFWSQTDVRYNVTDGYYDMGRWLVTGDKRECWAIYDDIVDGYFWLLNTTGWYRSKVLVTAKSQGNLSYSTGNGIVLAVGGGWDRDTVLHEYGHCIHYQARSGSWCPSHVYLVAHYPDTEADGGWALSEGWAEFFPCAVDNTTSIVSGYFGSIESTTFADSPFGHGDNGDWDGDVVEGAVAQVFWDIFDGASSNDYPWWDEPFGDYISNEFGKLWSIFLNHDPDNINEFWTQWTPRDTRIWAVFHHAKVIEPRNFAITKVSPSQPTVVLGAAANVSVTVGNRGDTLENFALTISADGVIISSFENITVESGGSKIFTTEWNTTGFAKREHTISASVFLFPSDLNATDDFNSCVVKLLSSGHDVGISRVVPSKTVVGHGYPLSIAIETGNYGTFPETFNITVIVNSTTLDTLSGVVLESGDSTMLFLDWNTASYPEGNYTISVYIVPLEGETDSSDNTLATGVVKVTVPGDVTGDFLVDASDVDQIRLFWQQRLPSTPANIDISGDGLVNIKDAAIVGANWGKHA